MNPGKGKYHTVVVTPTVYVGAVDSAKKLFLWTEIPGACAPRGTSLLRHMTVIDFADTGADFQLYFAQTKDADTSVTGALGATSSLADMTDAEVRTVKLLHYHKLDYSDVSSDNMYDFASGRIMSYGTQLGSSSDSKLSGIPMWSHEATQAQIDAGLANPGSIYVAAKCASSQTFTAADNLKIAFTFES